ncbi:head maturation protease, ClpP-related [Nonomuraea guangzhouensis]|uniref:Head maturation protease, ClpP-related n=1 Tax=Nonomuraea guangzhouensis TaxID=1291555 RepID=A0ABW4GWZ6_9ACTN|nr:head maturation protease, ClpP-related [Nonomuraea guangzhouensis]
MRLKTARPQARTNADWYRISNLADGAAEVVIYDEIGWFGVSAGAFLEELKAVTAGEISLRLNSPGGNVFDGVAIMNVLRSHPAKVTTYVDGLAASIASVIAMAGDRIVMQPHSQMMIHNPWAMCIGDAADMRDEAERLDRHSENIASVYAERAGGTVADWRERMASETWYSAEEAVAAGLADEVGQHREQQSEPDKAVANAWNLSVFRYAGREHAPAPLATAVGPHSTSVEEGAWDGPAQEKKLPSPVPVATAKAMYGWYDGDQVEDGAVPKSACKLPHHVVDADGKPGAASLNGVRNALARLPQTDGLTDAERSTIERHLRDHLPDEENHATPSVVAVAASQTPPAEPAAGPQETQEEDSMSTLSEGLRERLGITDAELDDDALLAALDDQLAVLTEPTTEPIETPAEPVAAKLPEGTVAIDEATLAELREQAAEGVAARAQQRVEARDRALDDAINAGKFPPARREHWARLYDLDPEGTRQTLASLADGVVPLQDVGEPGGEPTDSDDTEFDSLFSRKVG